MHKPIVFLTGHGDIPMTVQAMKAGAVDFLTKPVRDQTLLDAVNRGIERRHRPAGRRARVSSAKHVADRYCRLTRRERQVLRARGARKRSTSRSPSTSASARSRSNFTAAA
jgi:FixJ family two-component response regulator